MRNIFGYHEIILGLVLWREHQGSKSEAYQEYEGQATCPLRVDLNPEALFTYKDLPHHAPCSGAILVYLGNSLS